MKQIKMGTKREIAGWMFVLPWFIGLLVFFIQPVVLFFTFSFFDFEITSGGYVLKPLADGFFSNYIFAWVSDANYPQAFVGAFKVFAYEVPIIVFFSLFMSILLSQDFKGRGIMRTIFFLPIVVTSGVMVIVIARGVSQVNMGTGDGAGTIYDVSMLSELLVNSGFPEKIVEGLTGIIARVADLVWKSSVQILIFLISLLAIPESYYEAARVEGATGWEVFWKITFPVVSPFIFANTIYTLIMSSMSVESGVISYVLNLASQSYDYSVASAMMWMYFSVILIIVVLIFLLFRRKIFSSN